LSQAVFLLSTCEEIFSHSLKKVSGGNSAGFYLLAGNPTHLKGLQAVFAESDIIHPAGLASHPASLVFTIFNSFWH
jgi:hypothetical protein